MRPANSLLSLLIMMTLLSLQFQILGKAGEGTYGERDGMGWDGAA